MKSKILFLSIALIFTQSTFASLIRSQVECPTIDAVKSVGLHQASSITNGYWFVSNIDKFNTSEEWSFTMVVTAESQEDAVVQGNEGLDLIAISSKQENNQFTVCIYKGEQNVPFAFAVTPPEQGIPSYMKHFKLK